MQVTSHQVQSKLQQNSTSSDANLWVETLEISTNEISIVQTDHSNCRPNNLFVEINTTSAQPHMKVAIAKSISTGALHIVADRGVGTVVTGMPHTTAQIDNLNWKLKQKHRNSNKVYEFKV
jgi:hypothetical protein